VKERWLPGIAAGEVVVAVADGATAAIVPDGLTADLLLVRAGGSVHVVERSRVTGRPLRGADPSRRLSECDIELSDATLLTDDPAGAALVDRVGAAATSCLLVGLSQRLLDTTRDYVLSRRQFGRPIAEFQAVKHRLADVAMHTEAARSLAWHAAYRLQTHLDVVPSASALAKAAASRAAYLAGSAALQLHGGIGFTWEHDLHLRLQRGKAWEIAFGSTDQHRAKAGAAILGVA
jgi:alkylation response protein AidB-like acyl-CoA dehydrogenase